MAVHSQEENVGNDNLQWTSWEIKEEDAEMLSSPLFHLGRDFKLELDYVICSFKSLV